MKREVWSGSQLRGLQEVGIGPGGELVEEPAEAGGKPWGALCESRGVVTCSVLTEYWGKKSMVNSSSENRRCCLSP